MNKIKTAYIRYSLIAFFINSLLPQITYAASLSVSAGEYEDTVYIGENNKDLTPAGVAVFGLIDITEQVSLSASLSRFEDDTSFNEFSTVDLTADNWGVGLSYHLDNWLFNIDYGKSKEDIAITGGKRKTRLYDENFESPTWAITASYGNFIGDELDSWYWSLNSNIQFADWQRKTVRYEIESADITKASSVDEGESWFGNLGLSLSQFIANSANSGLIYGGSLTWYHLISGESSAVSRNGRSVSQIVNNNRFINASNFSQQVEGEQYGVATIFAGYHFNDAISVELNYASSFAADNNTDSVNLTINYEL